MKNTKYFKKQQNKLIKIGNKKQSTAKTITKQQQRYKINENKII